MNQQPQPELSIDDVYRLLGARDIAIHQLQQHVLALQARVAELEKQEKRDAQ